MFDYLPIAAIIEGRILCVHAGISPEIKYLDDFRAIDRFQEIPHDGPFTDIVWSDPDDFESGKWRIACKGAGQIYGWKAVLEFNQ